MLETLMVGLLVLQDEAAPLCNTLTSYEVVEWPVSRPTRTFNLLSVQNQSNLALRMAAECTKIRISRRKNFLAPSLPRHTPIGEWGGGHPIPSHIPHPPSSVTSALSSFSWCYFMLLIVINLIIHYHYALSFCLVMLILCFELNAQKPKIQTEKLTNKPVGK